MLQYDLAYTPPERFAVMLDEPIVSRGRQYDRLEVGEPTADQVRVAELHLTAANGRKGERMFQTTLISKITGIDEVALGAVPISKFNQAVMWIDALAASVLNAASEGRPWGDASAMLVTFDPPVKLNAGEALSIRVVEPTLLQMKKADTALSDNSVQRLRLAKDNLLMMCSDAPPGLCGLLPYSVWMKATDFLMGFTAADRATTT